jgi:prepilin-type N-terminal cleavage/methylation domain-containing protein
MDRIYKMMKRNNKGFTLVELMVVLLIIGILVAIAIPIYNKTQENAQERACQANLRTIDGAVAQYCAATGTDPETIGDPSSITIDNNSDLVKEKYLKEAPKCPKTKDNYKVTDGKASCTDTSHKYLSDSDEGTTD